MMRSRPNRSAGRLLVPVVLAALTSCSGKSESPQSEPGEKSREGAGSSATAKEEATDKGRAAPPANVARGETIELSGFKISLGEVKLIEKGDMVDTVAVMGTVDDPPIPSAKWETDISLEFDGVEKNRSGRTTIGFSGEAPSIEQRPRYAIPGGRFGGGFEAPSPGRHTLRMNFYDKDSGELVGVVTREISLSDDAPRTQPAVEGE
jgi:hypothetical protein